MSTLRTPKIYPKRKVSDWSTELLPPFLGKHYDMQADMSTEDYALKIELLITRIDVLVSITEEWYEESNMDLQADK